MPEPSILLCGPALDAEESAASLDLLRQVTLPNATKYLVTTGKFDSEGAAKTVNVDADYPADPAHLKTLAAWADAGSLGDPRFRDGYDLYCLRRIIARFKGFDYAVLLRSGAAAFQDRWPKLEEGVRGRFFQTFGRPSGATGKNLVIDLRDERSADFLDAAWEFYSAGAVYGMQGYSLDLALSTAVDSVGLERKLRDGARLASAPSATDTAQVTEAAVSTSDAS